MLLYLLKSGVCLVIFYGFYKLLLEKESIHTFKRYYLLSALITAFTIPLITFTQYVEVTPQVITQFTSSFSNDISTMIEPEQPNYLSIILWGIYALGVLLFSIKFIKNLIVIVNKIKHNPKHKNKTFTNVLLQDLITPHTFFRYIFLNKNKFETQQIPKEVLLHEETHAKQKHSFDVLFIELLQIVFWFNPLIYLIKHSIKLNHEFLADQAVLNKGITPSTYQEILLAFSSNVSQPQLANAINYSSIKKRFTIMKTKTSKTAFWLRSLILLPLLAILIYSFSEKNIVEKTNFIDNELNNEIRVSINKNRKVIIENDLISFKKMSARILKLKKRLIKKNTTIPKLFINVYGHITDQYLKDIENEIKKTNMKITEFKSNSLLLNNEQANPFFKGTTFVSEYMVFQNEKGELTEGISIPQNIEYSKSENLKSLMEFLIEKEAYLETLDYKKTEKEKTEVTKELNFVKSRIQLLTKKFNDSIKSAEKNKERSNLFITIRNNETIFINGENYTLENFEYHLSDIFKTNSSKEKLNPFIIYNSPDDDITVRKIKDILRKHKLLKVNKAKMNISYEDNKVHITQKKATPEQRKNYLNSSLRYKKLTTNLDQVNDSITSTEVTNFTINADTIEELKKINWSILTETFADNNPETIINLHINYKKSVLLEEIKIDSFNLSFSEKTSELNNIIKKAKKIIRKLKPI